MKLFYFIVKCVKTVWCNFFQIMNGKLTVRFKNNLPQLDITDFMAELIAVPPPKSIPTTWKVLTLPSNLPWYSANLNPSNLKFCPNWQKISHKEEYLTGAISEDQTSHMRLQKVNVLKQPLQIKISLNIHAVWSWCCSLFSL